MKDRNSFQIMVLDCPYDNWNDPVTRDWFGKIIQLKLNGYRREYPYGVLPVDTSDFIATHLVITTEDKGQQIPIMAYRSVAQDRCQKHGITLPILNLMKQLVASEHAQEIQKILDNCTAEKRRVCYASSLAVAEEFAGHPDLKDILKMINVCHTKEEKVSEILAGGALRFKMDRFYHFMGYKDLSNKDSILPPLAIPFACNEMTGFYHLTKFSNEALEIAKKYDYLWNQRIEIGRNRKNLGTKKAA